MFLEDLERELLESATRKNAERVSQLLADEFREFGSSGKIYNKSQIIELLEAEVPAALSLSDFRAEFLTSEIALVTYKAMKTVTDAATVQSLRSSIWILQTDHWQMLFHQGTKF